MEHYTDRTLELFQKISVKPELNRKILSKPTFKFIQMIIIQTVNKTEFGKGLYNEEEKNPNRLFSKTQKIIFYQKIIKLMELIKRKKINIDSKNILDGIQPELTNLFLQQMLQIALNNVQTQFYVERVIKGEEFDTPLMKQQQKQQGPAFNQFNQQQQKKPLKQALKQFDGFIFSRYKKQIFKQFFRQLARANNKIKHKQMRQNSCKVCLQGPLQMINLNCYHYSVCERCSKYLNKVCPICRAQGQFKRIYKA